MNTESATQVVFQPARKAPEFACTVNRGQISFMINYIMIRRIILITIRYNAFRIGTMTKVESGIVICVILACGVKVSIDVLSLKRDFALMIAIRQNLGDGAPVN